MMTARDAAIDFLQRGILCVPVAFKSKAPQHAGWQDLRLDTPELITSRFNCAPQNLGILTGEPSGGLVDVDLDFLEAAILADAFLPTTATYGRRGKPTSHRLFYPTPLPASRKLQFEREMVVELRSTGCQTIAPPSTHPSGEAVEWQGSRDPVRIDAENLLRNVSLVAAGALLARHWPKKPGMRDELAMALAGGLLRAGWQADTAERFILAVCLAAGDEEAVGRSQKARFTEAKIESEKPTTGWRTLSQTLGKGVVAKVRGWIGATSEAEPEPAGFHLTDLGNARRFVAQHGEDLRHCQIWGKWLFWTGSHWKRDDDGEVIRRTKVTALGMYEEAAKAGTEDARRAIALHATRTEAEGKLRAMSSLAESEPEVAITPLVFDNDPLLLNCVNGTIDLRTGRLRPHHREDYITRVIPVEYDPDALCPVWERTLAHVFPEKPDLVDFFQRAAGYSLSGLTSEQVVLILYGSGANGKSTLIETLRGVMGDYSRQIPAESLMIRRNDNGQSNDVANLKGARLVSAIECEEGRRLAESRIKALSGCDTIIARHLYSEFFEFKPEFKLWLATNHKPVIRGTDLAIWRRIRLIPFTVSFPPERQDRNLSQKLKAEFPGILAWAVRGCLEWQRNGLGNPEEVAEATACYRSEMDVLASFIQDRCIQGRNLEASAKDLYCAFSAWAEEAGEKKMNQRAFGLKIRERGFRQYHSRSGDRWLGLGLREV
jgi:putative DNA primase/helicase